MTGDFRAAQRDRRDELLGILARGGADDAALRELITDHVTPLVERLVTDAVDRGTVRAGDADDVVHDCALRLLSKARSLAEGDDEEPITRFEQYVTVVVRHAIEDYRRLLDPARTKLAHRVRYVTTHTRALAVWGGERLLCGLAEWRGRSDATLVEPSCQRAIDADDAAGLRRLVEQLVREAGAPVEMTVLIDAVAKVVGLGGDRFTSSEGLRELTAAPSAGVALEARQYLAQLWEEIRLLPVRQRRALLLNLRLEDGDSVTRALAALGIATVPGLAAALELPLDELLSCWHELPLPDERIGRSLGVTRQQVINLRKAARDRLARRMGRPRSGREER